MSYNPNIPIGTDKRAISQQQIRANFQAISNAFSDNHSPLGKNNEGRHVVLTLRPQGADPATSATQVAIYNKLDGSSIPELFYRPNNSQAPIQLTYPSIGTTTIAPFPARQYSFVAGPFVIYGGVISNPNNGDVITLTPVTTLRYVGLVSKDFGGTVIGSAIATNIAANTFTIRFQTQLGSSRDVYYLAIGN